MNDTPVWSEHSDDEVEFKSQQPLGLTFILTWNEMYSMMSLTGAIIEVLCLSGVRQFAELY